jgi:hypothetical protein
LSSKAFWDSSDFFDFFLVRDNDGTLLFFGLRKEEKKKKLGKKKKQCWDRKHLGPEKETKSRAWETKVGKHQGRINQASQWGQKEDHAIQHSRKVSMKKLCMIATERTQQKSIFNYTVVSNQSLFLSLHHQWKVCCQQNININHS